MYPFEMERDSVAHFTFNLFTRGARCNTSIKVWRVSREARACLFYDYKVSHCFNPACLRMLLSVPGPRSSFGLPGTVTSPTLLPCLYCL